jgi:hypothetical protein
MSGRRWTAVLAAMLALCAPRALAQDTAAVRADTAPRLPSPWRDDVVTLDEVVAEFGASPLLPIEHWAVQAARRAEALGLTSFFPAQRAVPRAQVAQALDEASRRAATPALRRVAAGWRARFLEEFPEYVPWKDAGRGNRGMVTVLAARVAAGGERWTGRLAPAVGYQSGRQPPQPLGDVSGPTASLSAGVATEWASLNAEGAYRGGEAVVREWDAALGAGGFQLSIGRAPLGYGWGRMGSVVWASPDAMPRIEFQSTRPFRLPWFLRHLGPMTLHTFAGQVNDPARHPDEPETFGMRVAAQPHPRLTLAASRASMFGSTNDPTTGSRLLGMLVGIVRSDFENQVVSLDARYRLPTDRVLPLTAYLEWGADDAAGALDEVPGRVAGLFVPALPGLPEVGVGAEYAAFAEACCGHGPWYLSSTFRGNWAVHARPLGHPLGGEGTEAAGYAHAELLDARLRLSARGWVRDRSDASLGAYGGGNLYTPARTGRSSGGAVDAALRLAPRAELRAGGWVDDGDGWSEQRLGASLAWTF